MRRPFLYHPQLEVLEDRLPPSGLHGGLGDAGKADARGGVAADAGFPPARSPLVPPQSHAFGRPFKDWNVLWSQWAIEEGLGGGSGLGDTVGRVRFFPTVFTPSTVEFDITLSAGTPFVAPSFFVFGETYDDPNVPDDTPQDIVNLGIFENATVRVELDGRVLLEGKASDLRREMFGPVYFDEPIVYTQPQPRGENLNATAALFVQGVGTLYRPLPVGEHTLVSTVHSQFFGDFQYTYHITVSPK
jgi:hypothetical protein